jgi:hypothetical protein
MAPAAQFELILKIAEEADSSKLKLGRARISVTFDESIPLQEPYWHN